MSQLHYWAQQEDRWHKQYLMAEKYCNTLEQRVHELEQAIIKAVHDFSNEDDRTRVLKTALGSIYEGS